MNLVYGTYNPSKVESMKKTLEGLEINLIGLKNIDTELIEAEESGKEPLDNAIQKAKTYYSQLSQPVFSCDTGLYFEGVSDDDQPGVYIKRIKGNDFTYREMLDYYRELASKYGGRLIAYYKNAICLMMDEKRVYTYDGEDLYSEKFYIVDKPHECYREGFPLDSLSVQISSGEYYYDLEEDESKNLGVIKGFRDFFISSLDCIE